MKFILDNWLLLMVATTAGAMLFWPAMQNTGRLSVTIDDAIRLMNHEKAVVVDVRQPQEYEAGHVIGSKNIPLDQLEGKLPHVAKNKNSPLILVCHSGVRSKRAATLAEKLGYAKPCSLNGGMVAWQAANLPVEHA